MKNKTKIIIQSCLVLPLLFLFPLTCRAAIFSISAVPYEGGYDLSFDKISPSSGHVSKEVNVSVSSDIAKQYRVTQSLFEPLTSLQGNRLPLNNFIFYGLRGSNRAGTLIQQSMPFTLGRQIIYTSDIAGTADSFTMVFDLSITPDVEPGSYRGRIGFSLEAVGSTQPPSTVFINVSAQVEVQSSVEAITANGSKNIRLEFSPDAVGEDVFINVSGGFGKQFRIMQIAEGPLVSAQGDILDWDAVKFTGSNSRKGMVMHEPSVLSSRQQVIYTSSVTGEGDNFVLTYALGDLSTQKAGVYKGKIKYILEGIGFASSKLIDVFGLEVDIPHVFDLMVSPEMGGRISFRDLRPNQPPKVQEVAFEVKTNTGKRYQVTQYASSLLTDKEGNVIPGDNFTLKEESIDTKGYLKFPEKQQIKEGQIVLFISDNKGSPDKFKVTYELTAPRDIRSGDYYTNFTYSVSEL